jgi:homocysteine S-methyltransferase
MSAAEAEDYHRAQILSFAGTDADMVSAFTLNYAEEAIGIAAAAKSLQMPVSLSFTLETDGLLPTGQTLREAIEKTDAATGGAPVYYMINCAHPAHFRNALLSGGDWKKRIRGVRANASTRSHAELNEATALDEGDPVELGRQYGELREVLPLLSIFGGCCGTDHRHVEQICRSVLR